MIARDSLVVIPVLLTAVMKSWPTRWEFDIALYARSTQLAAGCAVVGLAVVAEVLGEALADVLGEVAVVLGADEVVLGAVVAGVSLWPFPQAATATSRPAASAPWRTRVE
ncbi:hypothetical protein [Actinacidiphila yanglinensis]|uniref:hypothetical protein n=1 Tax=Actinacidiphila yanglinensis TaxID=310779 RepID=UPI000CDEE357|nr:hypothetical protein [Actinacidiphila yanglinensis]